MARLVAPAAPPLAKFAPKNFQNWSGVIAFGPVPMNNALNLSLKAKLSAWDKKVIHIDHPIVTNKGENLCGEVSDHIHYISPPEREEALEKDKNVVLNGLFTPTCSFWTLLKQSTTPLYLSSAAIPLCASWDKKCTLNLQHESLSKGKETAKQGSNFTRGCFFIGTSRSWRGSLLLVFK